MFCLGGCCATACAAALALFPVSVLRADMQSFALVAASTSVVGLVRSSPLRSSIGHLVVISAKSILSAESSVASALLVSRKICRRISLRCFLRVPVWAVCVSRCGVGVAC